MSDLHPPAACGFADQAAHKLRSATPQAAIILLALTICVGGCASSRAVEPATVERGTTHVVICWLNDPGNAAAREQLIERSRSFAQIPGVRRVSAGRSIPSTRPVVDSSYDVGIAIEFDSVQAMRAYEQNPIHKQAVKEVLQPLVRRFVIYDFRNE